MYFSFSLSLHRLAPSSVFSFQLSTCQVHSVQLEVIRRRGCHVHVRRAESNVLCKSTQRPFGQCGCQPTAALFIHRSVCVNAFDSAQSPQPSPPVEGGRKASRRETSWQVLQLSFSQIRGTEAQVGLGGSRCATAWQQGVRSRHPPAGRIIRPRFP